MKCSDMIHFSMIITVVCMFWTKSANSFCTLMQTTDGEENEPKQEFVLSKVHSWLTCRYAEEVSRSVHGCGNIPKAEPTFHANNNNNSTFRCRNRIQRNPIVRHGSLSRWPMSSPHRASNKPRRGPSRRTVRLPGLTMVR